MPTLKASDLAPDSKLQAPTETETAIKDEFEGDLMMLGAGGSDRSAAQFKDEDT
jgi:hypothetical protein